MTAVLEKSIKIDNATIFYDVDQIDIKAQFVIDFLNDWASHCRDALEYRGFNPILTGTYTLVDDDGIIHMLNDDLEDDE